MALSKVEVAYDWWETSYSNEDFNIHTQREIYVKVEDSKDDDTDRNFAHNSISF